MKNFSFFHPTLAQCWLLLLLSVIGQLLAGMLFSPIMTLYPDTTDVVMLFTYVTSFIPPLLLAFLLGKKQRQRNEITGDVRATPVSAGSFGNIHPVAFFIAIALSCYAIQFLTDPFLVWMPIPEWFEKLMSQITGGRFIWSFLTVAVCAPLLEELLCRGLMCRGMLQQFKNPWTAIFWSSFLFAVMHMNPWQGIPAFMIGTYFGWIYYRTHSLWATIFLHFVNNGTAVLMEHFSDEMTASDSFYELIGNNTLYVAFWLASLALLLFINIAFINRRIPAVQKTE